MTLVFLRSKCFVHQSADRGTKKFLAPADPVRSIQVPFWVAKTSTFKQGILDKSITNLTPADQMPGYVAPAVPVVVDEDDDDADDTKLPAVDTSKVEKPVVDEDDDDAEQTDLPKQPFGAQPMTPTQQAPSIGLRSNSRKGR